MKKEMHRPLTQIVAVALVGIGLVLIPGRVSWAQTGQGTPTVYKMTIKELCFNTTADGVFTANLCFVPGTQEFDLAAVAANGIAGSLIFPNVPSATYLQARATISCTFGLKGTVTVADPGPPPVSTDYKTTASGGTNSGAGAPAEGQYKLPDAQCDDPTADGGLGRNVRTSNNAPNNITLPLGGNVDLITDVTNGLFLNSGVLLPGNFSISFVSGNP